MQAASIMQRGVHASDLDPKNAKEVVCAQVLKEVWFWF